MTALGSQGTRRRPATGPPPTPAPADFRAEAALIRELWDAQKAHVAARGLDTEEQQYLDAHFSMPLTLRRRLAVIDWLARGIRPGDRVLEWGCRHAVDSCIYRRRFGDSLQLSGCDYVEGDFYKPFHDYSGLQYRRIGHPYRLDYADASFDVVTSNGVWEHVEDEENSLREIFRVLRPGGSFLVACLPNRLSYTEAIQRRLGHEAHDRLYSVASASALMAAAGFEVLETARRLIVPTMLNGFPRPLKDAYGRMHAAVWACNGLLERLWPVSLVASNLMFVARRPAS